MTSGLPRAAALLLALVVAGCASASDRLNDGLELQGQGRWREAAFRYADAVEKDRALAGAQDRLRVAGDSALARTLVTAADFWSTGSPLRAADEFLEADRLVARVREVGLRLDPSVAYGDLRRESFEWAIDALMSAGDRAREDGSFGEARDAYVRARSVYEASPSQRRASIDREIAALLDWGDDLMDGRRYRTAYARASDALELRAPPDRSVGERAESIRGSALALGTRRLVVLPVTTVPLIRDGFGEGFARRLEDDLELDHWREPPLFIAVADPVLVRRAVRDITRGNDDLTPRTLERIIGLVEGEFGVMIEVSNVTFRDLDVKRSARRAKTRDGRNTSYEVLTGRLVREVDAQVVLVGPDGRELRSFLVSGREFSRFERGSYEGDATELDLGRNERRLFNAEVQAEHAAAVEDEVLASLASKIAARIFEDILGRTR